MWQMNSILCKMYQSMGLKLFKYVDYSRIFIYKHQQIKILEFDVPSFPRSVILDRISFWTFFLSFPTSVSEFNKFEPRLKSAKNRFQLSDGLNLEKLNTILSGPSIFEPRLKFKPRLKFFQFGLWFSLRIYMPFLYCNMFF